MIVRGEITYERVQQIGVGQGMNSVVYLANDPQLGADIAIKEIRKTRLGNDPTHFFLEAQAMNAVGHPNVVEVKAAFQTSDLVCIAMPYYVDGSLLDLIHHNPIPAEMAIRVGQGVLSGVGSIHAAGYLHFDVKPSNIFFDKVRRPLVADFGQTRQLSATGVTIRPAMYIGGMPPECYSGVGVPQSDIYQVGMTLYRAVNGDSWFQRQLPVDATGATDDQQLEHMTCAGAFPDTNRFLPHVPRRLKTVIRKALRVDPGRRYPSAVDFASDLAKVEPKHDWNTECLPGDELRWTARRDAAPDIVVELKGSGRNWSVEIFGDNGSKQRRRDTSNWRSGISRPAALTHLEKLFRSVS